MFCLLHLKLNPQRSECHASWWELFVALPEESWFIRLLPNRTRIESTGCGPASARCKQKHQDKCLLGVDHPGHQDLKAYNLAGQIAQRQIFVFSLAGMERLNGFQRNKQGWSSQRPAMKPAQRQRASVVFTCDQIVLPGLDCVFPESAQRVLTCPKLTSNNKESHKPTHDVGLP